MKTFYENAASIGDNALRLITGDRAKAHGHAMTQHQCMADLWTTYLRGAGVLDGDKRITASQCAQLLLLMKISRDAVGSYNPDTFVDQVGYSCLAGAIRQAEEQDAKEGVQEGRQDRPAAVAGDRGTTIAPAWSGWHGNSTVAFGS